MVYLIHKPLPRLKGEIELAGSKSISNRALIIRALCPEPFQIKRLANAKDTELMQQLLASEEEEVLDAGPAGTTFRFMTAYLSRQPGSQVLTGSERMKQRPIGVLVDALRQLGAQIEYLEQEGYPPLKIGPPSGKPGTNRLSIAANTSSQYISALLLIAPTLPEGLVLELQGKIVSRPYIEMTLSLMTHFGLSYEWTGQTIHIAPQAYQSRFFTVEADWSAASYFYSLAAFSDAPDIRLNGLFKDSVQGDSILVDIMEELGVHTEFTATGIRLTNNHQDLPLLFEYNFLRCPDLAQTLAVICAGLGVEARFTGLETLRIKETDRIAALCAELAKVGVEWTEEQDGWHRISGQARVRDTPCFPTYEDHRMAMAFAPLAIFGDIRIEDPLVVGKSYPDFWRDLDLLGFQTSEI